jgi:hypothetical protein
MTLSAAERERRALIRANRPAPRADAERQAACRARKRAKRDALVAEAARIAELQRHQEMAIAAERDRIGAASLEILWVMHSLRRSSSPLSPSS